jgi:cation:H+ antiporter
MAFFFSLLLIVFCCVIIWRASDGFETASNYLGRNLSDGARGATINAIGSSTPELFTTFFFFFYYFYFIGDAEKANDGFAGGIGTTAGSAIFNGMIIPAVVILAVIFAGLARRVTVSRKVIVRDGLSLIFAEICLILLISGTTLYWYHGLILMSLYSIYAIVIFTTMSKKEVPVDEDEFYENETGRNWRQVITLNLAPLVVSKRINRTNAWALLLTATMVIGAACFLLVLSCELSAQALGINTYFVAVILASAATSVPDTILSYRDAMKGEYDDAVANALGSNIFDVCFALGLPLFVFTLIHGPLEMNPNVVDDITELRVLLVVLTVVAFVIYLWGNTLGKLKAVLLLGIYALFTTYIFSKAYDMEWAEHVGHFLRSILR